MAISQASFMDSTLCSSSVHTWWLFETPVYDDLMRRKQQPHLRRLAMGCSQGYT
ncbi:hypothetical protein KIN20_012345 [Parelaphostrongylus tenuis]|uniref:Uncharacterized protein n=1 Tax=Parelaphostrongylus tenuis TaxID=148309 RepID=A0AAD5QN34_PARTN|nr:hypothetical protein KIN20_012345 [Parelaphostrongylus tenuis]